MADTCTPIVFMESDKQLRSPEVVDYEGSIKYSYLWNTWQQFQCCYSTKVDWVCGLGQKLINGRLLFFTCDCNYWQLRY